MFMYKKINPIKMSVFDLKLQHNPNQNPSKLFYGYWQNNSEVYMEDRRPRMVIHWKGRTKL